MTPEVLARLTASSLRMGDGSSGVPVHTKEEIAGCLAGVSHGASYLAHYVYLGNSDYRADLKNEIRLALAGVWADKRWEIHKPGILAGLSELAILDWTPEWKRCPKCNGSKGRTYSRKTDTGYKAVWVDCRGCAGSGERRISQKDRAEVVGVTSKHWVSVMAKRYSDGVLPVLRKWDGEIRAAIKYGLSDERS